MNLTVNGGTLSVENCGYKSPEGGIEFDGGVLTISNGANVTVQNNGYSLFGDLYINGTVNLNTNANLTVTTSTEGDVKNAAWIAGSLNIDHATCKITQNRAGGEKTTSRGIYSGNTGVVNVTNNGVLIVKAAENATTVDNSYGIINMKNINVDKTSTLGVEGFKVAVAAPLKVEDDSDVTLDGSNYDDISASIIDGGSVEMQPGSSVVNGILTKTSNTIKVTATPTNKYGEALTRFDLSGFAKSSITISANANDSTNMPAYTYNVGKDHDGTAYVWAPEVTVTFLKNDQMTTNAVKETIRGNSLQFVNGMAPTPEEISGYDFVGWKYKGTDTTYTTDLKVNENITLVPVYEPKNGITADSYTGDYDGVEHTITNVKADLADSELSYSLVKPEQAVDSDWIEKAPVFKNAGTYTVYVRALNENAKVYIKSFTVTINQKTLTLTSGSVSGSYSGTPLTNSTVTADGFVTGEGAVYTVTGSQTAIGTSSNTFTYTMNAGTSADNYSITSVYGTLEVTRAITPATNDTPTNNNTTNTRTSTPTTNGRASTPLTGDQTGAPLAAGVMGGALLFALLAFLARKKYCK